MHIYKTSFRSQSSFLVNDEIMQVFSTSQWNVNPHIISLELEGGRADCWLIKFHCQLKLFYCLSFSYVKCNIPFWWFFLLSFMLWYGGRFVSSYFLPVYLQYMIFIWFSEADDSQNVTDQLLQNTHVDSNLRQSSGMAFYTILKY